MDATTLNFETILLQKAAQLRKKWHKDSTKALNSLRISIKKIDKTATFGPPTHTVNLLRKNSDSPSRQYASVDFSLQITMLVTCVISTPQCIVIDVTHEGKILYLNKKTGGQYVWNDIETAREQISIKLNAAVV